MKNNPEVRSWRNVYFSTSFLLILFVLVMGGKAQAQQPAPDLAETPSAQEPQPKNSEPAKNSNIFGIMPNRLTVEDPLSHPPPLTSKQKFAVALQNTFDPFEFFVVAVIAAGRQAQNDPKSWEQRWGAYPKRYAASFADQADFNLMVDAVLPSLLKEDPRYYRLGQGGLLKRTGYAASRILITRTDSGHKTFNFPEIAGAGISSGISNAYYPSEDRTLSKNLSRWGLLLGEDAALNLLKEFWPDIRHGIFKK